MARYQCRACGFDARAAWSGELLCPNCGSRTAVRAAIGAHEMTEGEVAAIKAAIPGSEEPTEVM